MMVPNLLLLLLLLPFSRAENVMIEEVGANGEILSVEARSISAESVDASATASSQDHHHHNLEKEIEELRARVERLERREAERGASMTGFQDRIGESKFEDHVVVRHEFEIDFDFTLISVLSLNRRRSMYDRAKPKRKDIPTALVLIGDTQGRLHVRFPNGTKVNSEPMNTGHESPLIDLRYDFTDRAEPTLVTAAEDGSVHVHRVTLFAHRRLLLGRWRRPRQNDEEEEEERERPQGVSMMIELESVLVDTSDRTGETTRLSAIENVYIREKHLVLLGDSSGQVRVFDVNGTILTVVKRPNFLEEEELTPVADVKQIGSRVAFAIGRHVQIFDVMSSPDHSLRCPPTPSTITSISFDVLKPLYLYVSTSDSILTYKMIGKGRKLSEYTCAMIHRSTDDESKVGGVGSRTESVKGYVVRWSSSSGMLRIFNTTGISDTSRVVSVAKGSLFNKASESKLTRDRPLFAMTPFLRRGSGESSDTLVLVSETPRTIRVAQLLLPYHMPSYDISWIRTPIMAVGALVVAYVFYQNAKKHRTGQSGGSFGAGPGGLPKDFNMEDFKKFAARYEAGGSDRVGDGVWRGRRR